jgi:4-oxalocrotonate tautomerase
MPFANFKLPEAALTKAQKADLVHRTTAMLVDYFGEAARAHTMVLIEDVPDGGYARADEVFIVPEEHRAKNA